MLHYTYLMIFPGLRSKLSFTILRSSLLVLSDVPYEKIAIDKGSDMPIAYES